MGVTEGDAEARNRWHLMAGCVWPPWNNSKRKRKKSRQREDLRTQSVHFSVIIFSLVFVDFIFVFLNIHFSPSRRSKAPGGVHVRGRFMEAPPCDLS